MNDTDALERAIEEARRFLWKANAVHSQGYRYSIDVTSDGDVLWMEGEDARAIAVVP